MKAKLMIAGLLAAGLSGVVADACTILVTVACPGGSSAAGIKVCLNSDKFGTTCVYTTDSTGFVTFGDEIASDNTYTVCVDTSTLPKGATLSAPCQTVYIPAYNVDIVSLEFDLDGNFCNGKPSGFCWLTGGGTIGSGQTPDYSYGGVVYPGCSPKAADGGNWNVVDHNSGIHFQGQHIVVDSCSGVPTKSPKVPVNIIDFHGDGIVTGIAGNPLAKIPVSFIGRAVDNHDGGAGYDQLYITVSDGTTTWLQIGTSAAAPAVVSTGNLQIHITSCDK